MSGRKNIEDESITFKVKTKSPPTLEVDPSADAMYIRFGKAKVARTVDCGAVSCCHGRRPFCLDEHVLLL